VVTSDGYHSTVGIGETRITEGREIAPAEQHIHKKLFDIGQYDVGSNLYFKGLKKAFTTYDPDMFINETDTTGCTNYYSFRTMLMGCVGLDMSQPKNVATLLYNIVQYFRIFEITLFPMNHTVAELSGTNTNKFQQVSLRYNSTQSKVEIRINDTLQTFVEATVLSALTTMLSNSSHYMFNLGVPDTDTNAYTLRGPWLKLFGNELDEGTFHVINKNLNLRCVLQYTGYDFINMHTNFSRAVYAANQQSDDWQIVPTNIFWTINVVSDPGKYTYYENMSSSGKIPYNTPIMDEIEVYFTDKYGDIIDDIHEFTCVFTFDFSDKKPASEPLTSKRARRTLAMF
jgi:hypothetical protein